MPEKLSCEEVERVIPWLLDDELDADYERDVEDHLSDCEYCQTVLESEGRLRTTLRRAADSIATPNRLRRRLNETLESEARRLNPGWVRYWPAAAAAAVLLVFAWGGTKGEIERDLDEAVTRHARDLPMDVVAAGMTQAPQVQRYFSGKLPFAVQLPALSGPAKLGGRVTQFKNRDAAYVRYDMDHGYRVSVFVYPDPGYGFEEAGPTVTVDKHRVVYRPIRGYRAAMWRDRGLVYSVVSDLPEPDFRKLVLGRGTVHSAQPVQPVKH